MKIRDYIEKLSFKYIKEILSNYNELETNAAIGDCLLRSLTEQMLYENGIEHASIIIWMDRVANECYRLMAEKAMEQGFTL
jgi:hypothetical protein